MEMEYGLWFELDCLQPPFINSNPDPFFNQMHPNSEEHQSTTRVGQYFGRTLNIQCTCVMN